MVPVPPEATAVSLAASSVIRVAGLGSCAAGCDRCQAVPLDRLALHDATADKAAAPPDTTAVPPRPRTPPDVAALPVDVVPPNVTTVSLEEATVTYSTPAERHHN